MKKADFTIVSIPDMIWFTCPYCGEEVGIKYRELNLPFDWEVICPECGEYVELGEYEYET